MSNTKENLEQKKKKILTFSTLFSVLYFFFSLKNLKINYKIILLIHLLYSNFINYLIL